MSDNAVVEKVLQKVERIKSKHLGLPAVIIGIIMRNSITLGICEDDLDNEDILLMDDILDIACDVDKSCLIRILCALSDRLIDNL